MQPIVSSRESWLTRPRIVGTPLAWASGSALYGGLLGGAVPAGMSVLLVVLKVVLVANYNDLAFLLPALALVSACMALAGALVGGGLGILQPALLDRVRHRVSLPVLAVGQTGVGALAGAAVGTSWLLPLMWLSTFELAPLLWFGGVGAVVGAIGTALWWLPFTMAIVLGRRTWPVTTTVASFVTALVSFLWVGLSLL